MKDFKEISDSIRLRSDNVRFHPTNVLFTHIQILIFPHLCSIQVKEHPFIIIL